MPYTDILYSIDDFVGTITLNRPDKLNAWTSEMDADVRAAIKSAGADESIRAIVLTGAGRGFCAGADMSRLSRLSAGETPRTIVGANGSKPGNFEQKFSSFLAVPKPIFAAINGPIAGIAFCLSLFCDFRYMVEGAKLTTAFAKRGLIAEHGSSWMLPRLIGPMNALDLLYSGRTVDAAEAERLGLVRKLPADNFLANVQAIAREMVTTSSPRSIGVIKRQVFQSYFQSLAEAWALADSEMIESFRSEDFKEGVAHFVEKRAPALAALRRHAEKWDQVERTFGVRNLCARAHLSKRSRVQREDLELPEPSHRLGHHAEGGFFAIRASERGSRSARSGLRLVH